MQGKERVLGEKKGRTNLRERDVNHAGFDDVRKNLVDNDYHHQKKGECDCMNTGF